MYTWPGRKSFASSYACKAIPKNYSGKLYNVLVAPIWNLFPLLNNVTPFLFSVGLLVVIYVLNYNVLPINVWNSVDGQYVDTERTLLFSLLAYYIISALITAFLLNQGCNDLIDQAKEYLE
jgi:hypothetical protein